MSQHGYAQEWQRAQVVLASIVSAAATIGVLYWARSIFIPVALAIFLTFVFSPVVTWFERRGIGRTLSVILVVGLALLVSGGLGAILAAQIASLSDVLPDRKDEIVRKLTEVKVAVVGSGESRFGKLIEEIGNIFAPQPRDQQPGAPPPVVVESPGPNWMGQVETFASPALEFVGQAAFAFLLTVFMLIKREDLRNRVIRLTGHGKVTTTTKAVDDASRRVSKFLFTQLLLNAGFALIVLVGLLLMGVKYAVMWGVLAFVMRYVPYIGSWIAAVPPALYVLAVTDGWGMTIAVAALFIVLELISNNVFEPLLYGPSMGLSEVAQLVAAGFWAFLWGPIGLILSGPLTVCLLVLGKHVSRFEFLDVLLGDEPVLPDRVAFYQRLAARDQDEASKIALATGDGDDAAVVYDRVIVPALCLAKRDHQDHDLPDEGLRFVTTAAREIGEEVALEHPPAATEGERPVRVLIAAARDDVDQAGAELMSRLLDPNRWDVELATDEVLAAELLTRIERTKPAAVVIASLPPGGVAHTRYLVTRIKARFPDLRLVVGRWGRGEDFADDDAQAGGADWVDHTLAATRKRLTELHSVFDAAAVPSAENGKARVVGTAGALVG
ncbi:AI-2E family transporter [Urbifossiella limnaea]|uniref:AI-2 transport protein TqsA n=1 Tax=Urbifossiella limnaea TaxID=2528023 RepID=A0A517XUR4_9BACT|nr:AI-2E family transporter [Urbifossiella limnaea]QDU21245.1 AI-2 transport protein TqsA [Urbifossiella limnaea]